MRFWTRGLAVVAVGAALLTSAGPASAAPPGGSVTKTSVNTSRLAATVPVPGGLVTVNPTRVLDTRTGNGVPKARVAPGGTVTVRLGGRSPLPTAGVASVVAAVTAVSPTAAGYLTAGPAGNGRRATIVNFQAAAGATDTAVLPLGTNGSITLINKGFATVDLVVDVTGYYRAGSVSAAGALTSVPLTRMLDTRVATGAPKARVTPGRSLTVQFGGRAPIPAGAAASVVAAITVVAPTAAGYLTAGPARSGRRATIVNFTAGASTTDLAVIQLGTTGAVTFTNNGPATIDVLADVTGFYRAGSASAGGALASTAPTRLLDTRYGIGAPKGRLAAGQTLTLPLWGRPPVPAGAAASVVTAVTVASPTGAGFLTEAPSESPGRATIVNFQAGAASTATTIAPLGPDGAISFTNHGSATIDLLADVTGYSLTATREARAPGAVTGTTANARNAAEISLAWGNPTDADLAGVMIRRQSGSTAPATVAAGTLVTTTTRTATSFTDSGLVPSTTYSYAFFAFDTSGNFGGRAAATATTQNPDPKDPTEILRGFSDLWTAGTPTTTHAFPGQVSQAGPLRDNDELVAWINQHATSTQRFSALQTADYGGASPNNYDQSITITPGLGSVLEPIYVTGRQTGALPLTTALLNDANGSSGAYVGVGHAKNTYRFPRPYLATDPNHPPAGEPCPALDNGAALAADRAGQQDTDAHGNLAIQLVPDTTDTSHEFSTADVNLTANYTGLCGGGSFPSGHTTAAYSDGIVLATLLPELGPEVLTRASEMGNNRLVLGVHYPLDVIGGRIGAEAGIAAQWSNPSYRTNVLEPARQELLTYLTAQCGDTLTACINRSTPYHDNPYGGQAMPGGTNQIVTDRASAVRAYNERLTYSLTSAEPTGLSPSVPAGAENLLLTTFPSLDTAQRISVLAQTEIASGGPLDQSTPGAGGSWERLDLAAAMSATVQLSADHSVTVLRTGGPAQIFAAAPANPSRHR